MTKLEVLVVTTKYGAHTMDHIKCDTCGQPVQIEEGFLFEVEPPEKPEDKAQGRVICRFCRLWPDGDD